VCRQRYSRHAFSTSITLKITNTQVCCLCHRRAGRTSRTTRMTATMTLNLTTTRQKNRYNQGSARLWLREFCQTKLYALCRRMEDVQSSRSAPPRYGRPHMQCHEAGYSMGFTTRLWPSTATSMIHSITCRGCVRAGPRDAYPSGYYGSPRLAGRGAGNGARQPAGGAPRQDIPIRRSQRGRNSIRSLGIARVP
jgi:hypothetical protein